MKEQMDLGKTIRESLPEYQAPAALEAWAREQTRKLDAESPASGVTAPRFRPAMRAAYRWRVAAGLMIAAAAGWGGANALRQSPSSASITTQNEIVDAHVRSLLPGHLFDVASSDRHTVKPWFTGKTDIAPPVVDLAAMGFPLVGGRLDYVDGHSAAVLAYGRGRHTINLFIWRSDENDKAAQSFIVRGYSMLHWTSAGLSYWAVSDAAPTEVESFREQFVIGAAPHG
jgi:anti-sigma factor RsiW